jgi:hypothetical protein
MTEYRLQRDTNFLFAGLSKSNRRLCINLVVNTGYCTAAILGEARPGGVYPRPLVANLEI